MGAGLTDTNVQAGLKIERPRSALHAGDFTEHGRKAHDFPSAFQEDLNRLERSESKAPLASSPSTPWYKPLSSPHHESDFVQRSPSVDIPNQSRMGSVRSRALALQSYSSSFVLKAPTSPLVYQSNNNDLDFSPINISSSPSKTSRRHTLPPQSFQSFKTQPPTLAQAARQPPSMKRETSLPYQVHRSRRSLTSISPLGVASSPQLPIFLRSRRTSFASDASPIQHASMVGSYEESILRGRMSTTPSKPLDFTAQIGALGKGDCKPKYPAHVSVGFPAVYYSWGSAHGGSTLDEPSPYVGLIDLEHKLTAPPVKEKQKRRSEKVRPDDQDGLSEASNSNARASRRREKRKRRSPSPNSSLMAGGCYRIPQQGQLQILIKNPHKTAVKLFLVPYDLKGMEPGTKTFVRQRCYSAGPIIEKPLTSRSISEPGTEGRYVPSDPKSRPTLRYLIQLNICCPAKGRCYLYKNIHVVFANRVPDNKEKLQNEILWPEPRYSPWKPSNSTENMSSSTQISDKVARSISYSGATHTPTNLDVMDGLQDFSGNALKPTTNEASSPLTLHPISKEGRRPDVDAIQRTTIGCRDACLQQELLKKYPSDSKTRASTADAYTKLSPGEAGYGGVFGRPGTPEPGEGLLARRLKGLGEKRR